MPTLNDVILKLQDRVAELERRRRNAKRTGTVDVVDNAKGLARVKLVDGDKSFVTDWLPWKEVAAGMTTTHIPPVVGQQVDVLSENGELTDGVIDFSLHSNQNKRPHNGPQAVIVHGNTRITLDEGNVDIKTANYVNVTCHSTITLSAIDTHVTGNLIVDGNLETKGNGTTHGNVDFKGSYVRHNGKNIGDTHKHLGVRSGGSKTDVPE